MELDSEKKFAGGIGAHAENISINVLLEFRSNNPGLLMLNSSRTP
jgi:hypothetical protein